MEEPPRVHRQVSFAQDCTNNTKPIQSTPAQISQRAAIRNPYTEGRRREGNTSHRSSSGTPSAPSVNPTSTQEERTNNMS
jgi:hypothetical protein